MSFIDGFFVCGSWVIIFILKKGFTDNEKK